MTSQDFIHKFSPIAIEATADTTLLPSVMMAQAAIESGWGKSTLASKYNNYFGIKADASWKGPSVSMSTQEYVGGAYVTVSGKFRSYSEPSRSFRDRVVFLCQNPRYKKVFQASDPLQQANLLQQAGFATDPNYASKLISTINQYGLVSLDQKKK